MLIRELTAEHIYLACGHTDMRKSLDGLVFSVKQFSSFSSSKFPIVVGKFPLFHREKLDTYQSNHIIVNFQGVCYNEIVLYAIVDVFVSIARYGGIRIWQISG